MNDIGRGIGDAMVFFAILAIGGGLFSLGAVIGLVLMFFGFTTAGAIAALTGAVAGIVGGFLVARAA